MHREGENLQPNELYRRQRLRNLPHLPVENRARWNRRRPARRQ